MERSGARRILGSAFGLWWLGGCGWVGHPKFRRRSGRASCNVRGRIVQWFLGALVFAGFYNWRSLRSSLSPIWQIVCIWKRNYIFVLSCSDKRLLLDVVWGTLWLCGWRAFSGLRRLLFWRFASTGAWANRRRWGFDGCDVSCACFGCVFWSFLGTPGSWGALRCSKTISILFILN